MILFKEVLTLYEAYRQGESVNLKRPRPYRDYISWIRNRIWGKAEVFWRETKEFTEPTSIARQQAGYLPGGEEIR